MRLDRISLDETDFDDYSEVCFNLGVRREVRFKCAYGRVIDTYGFRSFERLLRAFYGCRFSDAVRVYSGGGFLSVPVGELNSWAISHICDLVEANCRRSNFLTLRFRKPKSLHPASMQVVRHGDLLVLGDASVPTNMFYKFDMEYNHAPRVLACWDESNLRIE